MNLNHFQCDYCSRERFSMRIHVSDMEYLENQSTHWEKNGFHDYWDLIQQVMMIVFLRRCSRYVPNVASKVILPVAFVGAVNTLVSVYAAHSVGDMCLDICISVVTFKLLTGPPVNKNNTKKGPRKVSLGACLPVLGEPRYPIRECLIVDGLTTVVAALFGSPFGTCVYCGHPQFKQQALFRITCFFLSDCIFGELFLFDLSSIKYIDVVHTI